MLGRLSVIGIGPGDPELLTLKAARIIRESKVLCFPKGREEGSSLALSIVEKAVSLDGKEILEAHFPMRKTRTTPKLQDLPASGLDNDLEAKWDETAENILGKLKTGADVAFLTLGDPTVYSTFFYLYDKLLALQPDLKISVIPGVSSVNASAATAGLSLGLGNEKIAILPANYMDKLKPTLELFDTVVLMKANKVFNEILGYFE